MSLALIAYLILASLVLFDARKQGATEFAGALFFLLFVPAVVVLL